MKWRPDSKDWGEKRNTFLAHLQADKPSIELYEAGADAMVLSLRENCFHHLTNPEQIETVYVDTDGKSGCLVFIPDEK